MKSNRKLQSYEKLQLDGAAGKIRFDVIFIAVVLIAAAVCFAALHFLKQDGETVQIMVDGSLYEEVPLAQEQTITVENALGVNKVVISGGKVTVESADCPDKICVRQGSISKSGETIICLPHKLVVAVKGRKGVDAMAQ